MVSYLQKARQWTTLNTLLVQALLCLQCFINPVSTECAHITIDVIYICSYFVEVIALFTLVVVFVCVCVCCRCGLVLFWFGFVVVAVFCYRYLYTIYPHMYLLCYSKDS